MMLLFVAAAAEDMSGKMLNFPEETKTAHVRLNVNYKSKSFSAFTVCLRAFTDLKRDHSLFSLATRVKANEILIFYDHSNKHLELYIHDVAARYEILDYVPNKWHSICTTWNSKTGVVQLWFNGQPLTRKFVGSTVSGIPVIILGQEQDRYGSRFDTKQSFVGMLTDVHMWDYEIAPCEIQKYVEELNITPGNVINWAALDFQAQGRVFVEKKQVDCNSVCLL